MSTLNADIKAAIQKNLPAQVADELKDFIAESQEKDEKIANLQRALDAERKARADSDTLAKRYATELEGHSALDEREKAITEREQKYAASIATLKMQEAEKRSDDLFKLVETVFRNPLVKRQVFQNDVTRDVWKNGYNEPVKVGSSTSEEITES